MLLLLASLVSPGEEKEGLKNDCWGRMLDRHVRGRKKLGGVFPRKSHWNVVISVLLTKPVLF